MLKKVIEGFPVFLKAVKINGIYKMNKSIISGNSGANLVGTIVLYENAFKSKLELKKVMAHEYSHSLFNQMRREDKESYIRTMGWKRIGDENRYIWLGRKDGYVEPDGSLNPSEDFSNNIEYYLFERLKLMQVSKKAFDWIQKRFGEDIK